MPNPELVTATDHERERDPQYALKLGPYHRPPHPEPHRRRALNVEGGADRPLRDALPEAFLQQRPDADPLSYSRAAKRWLLGASLRRPYEGHTKQLVASECLDGGVDDSLEPIRRAARSVEHVVELVQETTHTHFDHRQVQGLLGLEEQIHAPLVDPRDPGDILDARAAISQRSEQLLRRAQDGYSRDRGPLDR